MKLEPNVPLFHGATVQDADFTPIRPGDSTEVSLCKRAIEAKEAASVAFHTYEANRYVEGAFQAYRAVLGASEDAARDLAIYRQNRARYELKFAGVAA